MRGLRKRRASWHKETYEVPPKGKSQVKKSISGSLLGALGGDPDTHLLVTSGDLEFFAVSCVLGGQHFHKAKSFFERSFFAMFGKFLEDPNLLKLRSLDSSCPFFLSDTSIWGE